MTAVPSSAAGEPFTDPRSSLATRNNVFPSRPNVLTARILLHLVSDAPASLEALDIKEPVVKQVLDCCSVFDNPSVARPAREARELLKELHDETLDTLLAA
jgi:hypothetical protein